MNEEEMQKEETSPLLIKREPVDESDIKDYAETTMNELLGWYGYGKVDSRDTQGLNLHRFTGTSSPPPSQLVDGEDGDSSLEGAGNNSASPTSSNNGGSKTDQSNLPAGYVVCAWCQKVGMKLFTLKTANGQKAFCSELCFTQCRRASFKKNKVCDWCKHIRHTVNYVDFQDGEQQLQFCSDKCLNQYKMNIFCKETQAHLQMHPHLQDAAKLAAAVAAAGGGGPANREGVTLITPDLWLRDCHGSHDSLNGQDPNKTDGSGGSSSSTKYDETTPGVATAASKTRDGVANNKRTSRDKNSSNSRFRHHHHHHHHHRHHHHRNAASTSTKGLGLGDAAPDPLPKSSSSSGRQSSPLPHNVPNVPPSLIPPQLLAAAAAALAAAPPPPPPPLPPPSHAPELARPPFNPFLPPIPFHADLLRLPRSGAGTTNPPPPPFLLPPGLGLPSDLGAHPPRPQNPPNNNNNNNNSSGALPRHPFLSPLLSSLLPPMAVLVPYPVVLPIPIPIPIPLPFPVPSGGGKSGEKGKSERKNGGNLSGKGGRRLMSKWLKKGGAAASRGNKRVESVITRLPKYGGESPSPSPSRSQAPGPGCVGRNAFCRVEGNGDSSSSNGLDEESSDLSDFPDSDMGMDLGEEDDTDEDEELLENRPPGGDAGKTGEGKDGKSVGLLPMFSSQEKSNTFSRERIDEAEPELKRKCVRTRLTAK